MIRDFVRYYLIKNYSSLLFRTEELSYNDLISPKEAKNRFLHRCYTYTSTSMHNMRNKDNIEDYSKNKEDEIVNNTPYSEEPLYSTVKKKKKKSGKKKLYKL